ncbi:MAG: trypsin-like serine protease [Syntrophomonadaceae bacterium]|nr:trypsin-like serine protease [Syntrophomonadaceae bacterium]
MQRNLLIAVAAILLVLSGFLGAQLVDPLMAERPVEGVSAQNEGSVVQTARDISSSIVSIVSYEDQGDFFSKKTVTKGGSGVIIDPSGYIVTNHHVIANAKQIQVSFHDETKKTAKLVGGDVRTDLALIKVNGKKLKPADWGDSDKLLVGQDVIAIGNPLGAQFARSVTAGVVSGLNRVLTTEEGFVFRLIQTDAAINPGNSGGALANLKGEVIGINTIKISVPGFEGMGFAIPSNQVVEVINSLRKDGRVERPVAGLQVVNELTPELATYYNLPVEFGVAVMPLEGGPSAKAGLKEYDIIRSVNGQSVKNAYDLQNLMFGCKVDDEVTFGVTRLARAPGEKLRSFECKVRLCSDGVK